MARSDGGWMLPAPPLPVVNGLFEFCDDSEVGGRRDAGPEASEPRVTDAGARVKLPAPPRPV